MKTETKTTTRVVVCLLAVAATLWMRNVANVVMAYILASYPNYDATLVQNIQTLPGLVAMFVSLVIGPLALKYNKKKLMILVTIPNVIFMLAFSFVGGNNLYVLLIAAALAGIPAGAGQNLAIALAGDYMAPEKKAGFISWLNIAMSLGQVMINSVGGFLASGNGGADWPKAFYPGLVVIPVLILFILWMPNAPKESAQEKERLTGSHTNKESLWQQLCHMPKTVWLICIANVFVVLGLCSYSYNISVYVITENKLGSSAETGLIQTLYTFLGIISSALFVLISKKLKEWMVPVGIGIMVVNLTLMVLIRSSLPVVYLAASLFSFGFYMITPNVMAKLSNEAGVLGPIAISIYVCAGSIGTYASPYVNTFFANLLRGTAADKMLVGVIELIIALIAYIQLFPMSEKRAEKTAQTKCP